VGHRTKTEFLQHILSRPNITSPEGIELRLAKAELKFAIRKNLSAGGIFGILRIEASEIEIIDNIAKIDTKTLSKIEDDSEI